jgi:hypothetical protein
MQKKALSWKFYPFRLAASHRRGVLCSLRPFFFFAARLWQAGQMRISNPAMLRAAVLLAAGCASANAGTAFLSVGDWGGYSLGGAKITAVDAVSATMAATASSSSAEFVLNVGDNFYYCGIQNTSDPQISAGASAAATTARVLGGVVVGWGKLDRARGGRGGADAWKHGICDIYARSPPPPPPPLTSHPHARTQTS